MIMGLYSTLFIIVMMHNFNSINSTQHPEQENYLDTGQTKWPSYMFTPTESTTPRFKPTRVTAGRSKEQDRRTMCRDMASPNAIRVATLMMEFLKHLEGNDAAIMTDLRLAANSKMIRPSHKNQEFDASDAEDDESYESGSEGDANSIKVESEGEKNFVRLAALAWLVATDRPSMDAHGLCPLSKVSDFLKSSPQEEIQTHLKYMDSLIKTIRLAGDEFIQSVLPWYTFGSTGPELPGLDEDFENRFGNDPIAKDFLRSDIKEDILD